MTVGILIITHDEIGETLLHTASQVLGACPLDTKVMSVNRDCEPVQLIERARGYLAELEKGNGVLVLTDMFGSTPSNIACKLIGENVSVVAGVNLPMLLRLLNYPSLSLVELVEKAVSGGREGIMDCRTHHF